MLVLLFSILASAATQADPAVIPDRIIVTGDPAPGGAASVAIVKDQPPVDASTVQKITVVRVRLKRDGDIKDCAIATSSGSPALDENACMLAQRLHTLPPMEKSKDGFIYVRPRYEGKRDFLQNVVWRL